MKEGQAAHVETLGWGVPSGFERMRSGLNPPPTRSLATAGSFETEQAEGLRRVTMTSTAIMYWAIASGIGTAAVAKWHGWHWAAQATSASIAAALTAGTMSLLWA